jgi:uncharacterized protein YuzE
LSKNVTEIAYDPDADAAYFTLSSAAVLDSAEVSPGVVVDYDVEGRVVGIELLNARTHLAPGAWSRARRPTQRKAHAAE